MEDHESIFYRESLDLVIYAGPRQGRVFLEILNGAFEDSAHQGVPDLYRL